VVCCCNPSLGLATKAKVCKVAGQEGNWESQHIPGSVKKCEGMNPHTPREFHLGNWSPSGLLNLQRGIAGVKTQWLEEFFISMESSWTLDI